MSKAVRKGPIQASKKRQPNGNEIYYPLRRSSERGLLQMAKLTELGLKNLAEGTWKSDGGGRGAGTLIARKLSGGAVQFYYRYTGSDSKRKSLALGQWSGAGGPMTLKEARSRAAELSARYVSGDKDLHDLLEIEAREQRQMIEAARREEEHRLAKKKATLGALLEAYSGQLLRDGKSSAKSVSAAFSRHIQRPWPRLWATPAEDITTDDLLDVVARVANDGKHNEARKLRSYLQSAYASAIRARQDARALPELRALKVSTNPARDLATIEGASSPGERALSLTELTAYWNRIVNLPNPQGALLRFHLLTGAQRIAQLGRVTLADLDQDTRTIALKDGKGRRKTPRVHVVPLIPAAEEALTGMLEQRDGDFLVSGTCGRSGVSGSLFRSFLEPVVDAMEAAGELEKGRFTAADLRRTVETRLAAAGVDRDVRAQLQSHGLGHVQARHYDRYEYLDEKRSALERLHELLTGPAKPKSKAR